MFHSFQGYCRLALATKEMDTVTAVNPQREGVYKYDNSVGLVAEGDAPTFNFLQRLTSTCMTTNTFNGVALTIMDIGDLQGDIVSSN
jgi:hypothetical protein